MKRITFLILIAVVSIRVMLAQSYRSCAYYDGYWGDWKNMPSEYTFKGNHWDFVYYEKGKHPSQWTWHLVIYNYYPPTKEEIKAHKKNNEWFVYEGTLEFYVADECPTLKSLLKVYPLPFLGPNDITKELYQTGKIKSCKLTTMRVKVKIAPYDKYPRVYNIWSLYESGVALGINLGGEFKWGEK